MCDLVKEDATHVLMCRHVKAHSQWKQAVDEFKVAMVKTDTHLDIVQVVTSRLLSWSRSRDTIFSPWSIDEAVLTAVEAQDKLGWLQFACGRMVKPWRDAQDLWLT